MSNLPVLNKMCGNTIVSIGGNGLGIDITFEDGLIILITRDSQGLIKLKEVGEKYDRRELSKKVEVSSSLDNFNKFIGNFTW